MDTTLKHACQVFESLTIFAGDVPKQKLLSAGQGNYYQLEKKLNSSLGPG